MNTITMFTRILELASRTQVFTSSNFHFKLRKQRSEKLNLLAFRHRIRYRARKKVRPSELQFSRNPLDNIFRAYGS